MSLCRSRLFTQIRGLHPNLKPTWSSAVRSISFFKQQKEKEEVEKEVEEVIAQTDRRKVTDYDGHLVKDRLHTLQTNRLLTTKKGYKPPEDVQDTIEKIVEAACTVETSWQDVSFRDARLKYKVLTKLIEEFNHDIPNYELNAMKTVADAVRYFEKEVRETNSYEDLSLRQDLPPNLHIQLEYNRFNPETDTLHEGKTAFPGEYAKVASIKYKRKYATVDTRTQKPGYYNHYYDY